MGLMIISENPKVFNSMSAQSLSDCQLAETEWMHAWIKENYQLFFGKLNYEMIGQEINVTGAGSEGYLDFLAIDLLTGKTVVIEAKRDDYKHRDLIGQIIEYASGISKFNKDKFNQLYQDYNNSADMSLDELFGQQSFNISMLNSKQQIILIVQKSSKNQGSTLRLRASCAYLREQGMDINILEFSWYTMNPERTTPRKGDIIEAKFVWEMDVETGKQRIGSQPANEDDFLVDKDDNAIELYRSVISMLELKRLWVRRRPATTYITFYGKKRAFMTVEFIDKTIKLRLRLPEDYQDGLAVRVNPDVDNHKLVINDKFLHQVTLSELFNEDKLFKVINDSYDNNQ